MTALAEIMYSFIEDFSHVWNLWFHFYLLEIRKKLLEPDGARVEKCIIILMIVVAKIMFSYMEHFTCLELFDSCGMNLPA